jgi:hypothetical protein
MILRQLARMPKLDTLNQEDRDDDLGVFITLS